MCSPNMSLMIFVVVILAVECLEAQDLPKCVNSLTPCLPALLNSTKAEDSCCKPLLFAVKNEMTCLCAVYNNPELLKLFNVDPTQVIALIDQCGYKVQGDICHKDSAPAPTAKSPAASAAPKPAMMSPPPAGESEHEHHSGCTSIVAWTGISAFLLVSATLMLH